MTRLETTRLVIRPFTVEDAPTVAELGGDFAIADGTLAMPHPYEEHMAVSWIKSHTKDEKRVEITFAIERKSDNQLIGAVGIRPKKYQRGEIGYWIGKPFWNQGYMSEAAQAIVEYGFETLKLNKVYASHFARNPASGRVMQKIGMVYEGTSRACYKRWDKYEDAVFYGILRSDWEENKKRP